MLQKLGEVLRRATNKITNAIFLDKNFVDSIIKDLQRALIEADVSIPLVKQLSDKIRKAALDKRIKEIEKKEHIIKLLHDELIKILGEYKQLKLESKQNKIMLLGLYGAGKTTTIAKLGNYYSKRGKKVALVGLDVHRPAAKEQLKQLAEKNKLTYFIDEKEGNANKTWKKFKPKLKDYNTVLIDTAGRHNLDKNLVKEIKDLSKEIKPTESVLVMPADIGQAAKKQTQDFKDAVNISGVIVTRMDSSAKGGGALTACAETKAPVYFVGTGEKINDIEEFEPEGFLSRLLGMGDLQSLIEKIRSVTDEKKSEKIIEGGKLTLEDVVEQVKSMNSLGGFDKLKSMIPGFSSAKIPDELLGTQEEKIAKWEHIIKSMTPDEKRNPEIFDDKKTGISRINRVAKGAGVNNSEIRSLLKQYKMLSTMIKDSASFDPSKSMNQKQIMKLAKKFMKGKKFKGF
ncbi:signal recognition particle protein [Candidatus Pacearchaeota archaeon]|nr:signal recognition particle protein [Candidatus Pacearchaeota archaeon]|tara:strand:- start:1649 stop:3019 length:1371 start_codon:yes stop_codon:yes gene_type:complete